MPKKNRRWFSKKRWARFTNYYILMIPAFVILGVLFIYPGILALKYSFTNFVLVRPERTTFIGLRNYIKLIQMDLIHNSFWVTLYISSITIILEIIISFAIALMLHQKIKYKSLFRTILLVPMLIAPVAFALQWKWLFVATFGIVNRILMGLGIIQNEIPWLHNPYWAKWNIIMINVILNFPFLMFVILAGLESLPDEPFEAAKIDGVSSWQSFWYLTLPMVLPVLMFGTVYTFFNVFQIYGPIRVLTEGGPGQATQVLSMAIYELTFHRFLVGMGSALSIITIVIVFPLIVFFVKATAKV